MSGVKALISRAAPPVKSRLSITRRRAFFALLVLAWVLASAPGRGAGVTVITHGFNGNVTDWVIPMAEAMPGYASFPGTTDTCYELAITRNGSGQYVATISLHHGVPPTESDSGEIFIKLDWSTLSGVGGASTTTVANATVGALLSTTLIPELGGRALAELPMHLIGHSRGGSVVTEMARLLGAQGVWVDQVTTLDPRPVAGFGDADVTTYANVLYADNFWQTLGDGLFVPNGQSLFGAYNRKLTSLSGGYSSSHSDVHLWYHGTIDLATPCTDTQATIDSTQRSAWWTTTEMAGAEAGFRYSAIGGGDRLSSVEPAGAGNGRINDGFNKKWHLGGGVAANRTSLPANSGLWPNVIRAGRTATTPVPAGEPFDVVLYHQSGANGSGNVEVRIFLDVDFNPYSGPVTEIDQRLLPNTGTNAVLASMLTVSTDEAIVAPGTYTVGVRISDGVRTRYVYLPDELVITSALSAPRIDTQSLTWIDGNKLRFNVLASPGQTVAVRATSDFVNWVTLQTSTFTGSVWQFTDADAGTFTRRFYKAVLVP